MRERVDTYSDEPSGDSLHDLLGQLDRGAWPQYRRLIGEHSVGPFRLVVDRVPPDPFAGPARMRLSSLRSDAGLPADLASGRVAQVALEDFVARRAGATLLEHFGPPRPGRVTPPAGYVAVEPCSPAVLERSACRINDERIELRLWVDLPVSGRSIRGLRAQELLCDRLLRIAPSMLIFSARALQAARDAVRSAQDHAVMEAQLEERGLVAFLADGSLLARAGGEDCGPRRDGREIALRSPDTLAVQLETAHSGTLRGLGIPSGVTLIVGGAFHGKSTLLDAIAAGVHPHCVGDGRERVVSRKDAVVVRAEDGRPVRSCDISGFLGELPSGARSAEFTTERASGSTSQASSVVEMLEVGARALLIDEDRSAANFMIRDGRMQRLVPADSEPLVPYLARVRELSERFGVTTVMVTGGSGDYLEAADCVVQMLDYQPHDATTRARAVVAETRTMRIEEARAPFVMPGPRTPSLDRGAGGTRLRSVARGTRSLRVGDDTIELSAVEQLVEPGQVRTIGKLLLHVVKRMRDGMTLDELLDQLDERLDAVGLDGLDGPAAYDLSRPRRFEVAAALNRWRALKFERVR